ncbi:unnamed protein product [Heterobilharzia americana]|nr:unnamed protein product [Heterobilharzia americana]
MLYGGPLGTYLSGLSSSSLSSASHLTSPSSNYTSPNSLSNSNYYSGGIGGLRRSSSRYRNSGGSNLSTTSTPLNTTTISSSSTTSGSNPYSSYYTPPVRRKYGTPETDSSKSSRYFTRTQGVSSNSGTGSGGGAVGSSTTATGNTSAASYSGLPQYPRRSPNKICSSTGYTVGGIGTSSSWNSVSYSFRSVFTLCINIS